MTSAKVGRTRAPKEEVTEKQPEELKDTLKAIQKRFGNVVSTGRNIPQPDRISTGIFMLDLALLGGVPVNRFTELRGNRHSGKTTCSLKIIANAQKKWPDRQAVLLDLENSFDAVWAEKNGVDTDSLLVVQPTTGEEAADIWDALIGTKEVSLVVLDSLAHLTPMKEISQSAEDGMVGEQSRLIARAVRKAVAGLIHARLRGHDITLVNCNQLTSAIGGWSPTGDPVKPVGGKKAGFANSVELVIKNKEMSAKNGRDIEVLDVNEHAIKIEKNRLCAGMRSLEFRMRRSPDEKFGLREGEIEDASSMLAFSKKYGFYSGGGSSWTLAFPGFSQKFSGADEASRYLYSHPEEKWALRNILIRSYAEDLGFPISFLSRFD